MTSRCKCSSVVVLPNMCETLHSVYKIGRKRNSKINQEQIWTGKHWRLDPRTADHCSYKALQTWVFIIKNMYLSNTCPWSILCQISLSVFVKFCFLFFLVLLLLFLNLHLVFYHYLKSERIFFNFSTWIFHLHICQYTDIHGINVFR